MSLTDTLTTAEDRLLEAIEKIQEPAVGAVRKVAETVDGILPDNRPSVPSSDKLPPPKELVDFYFSFRQRLLDNQRKFATAILDAGSSSAPAAKKPSKPTVAKKVAAA